MPSTIDTKADTQAHLEAAALSEGIARYNANQDRKAKRDGFDTRDNVASLIRGSIPILSAAIGDWQASMVIPGSGNVLMATPVDIKARFRIRRTPTAKASGLILPAAFAIQGAFDSSSCTIILDECDGAAGVVGHGTYPPFSALPLIEVNCPMNSDAVGSQTYLGMMATGNELATPAYSGSSIAASVQSPRIGLFNTTTAQVVNVTFPNPGPDRTTYANGQEMLVGWFGGTILGTQFKIAQFAQGVSLKADRSIYGPDDKLLLEWHSQKNDPVTGIPGVWVETNYISATYSLFGKGSITPASLASGAFAAIGTITVPNAAVGDFVDSVSSSTPTGGAMLWAEYTAANTATIYAKNDKGSAYAPGATTYTVSGHRA